MQNSTGDGYHYEGGWRIVHNPGSGQLCNPGGLSGWIEARERNSASTKKAARADATKAARKQRAEDFKVLGPLYGELAQLLRSRRAAANTSVQKPTALRRTARRRRRQRIKGD